MDNFNVCFEDIESKVRQIMTNSTTNLVGESIGVDNESEKTIEPKEELISQQSNSLQEQEIRTGRPCQESKVLLKDWARELFEREHRQLQDTAGDIAKKVKVGMPDCDGRLDFTSFASCCLQLKNILVGMTCQMKHKVDLLR